MKYFYLLWAGLKRKPLRTTFTLFSIFFSFLLFALLAATRLAFDAGVDLAGADRILVINKITLINPLPQSYGNRIAQVDGVEQVVHATWFGGYYQEEKNFFAQFPTEEEYLDIYPELLISDEERAAWVADRSGAVIGKKLADRFGWKVGDRIPVISPIWSRQDGGNTWEFNVRGIFRGDKEGVDTTYMLFHYDYLDEGRAYGDGTVGWYIVKVADPDAAPAIAERIDALFANSPNETKTSPEKAFVQGFINQVGDIGKIFVGVVTVVLFTLFLVMANTMAQGVRERSSELAVMNILGFSRKKLAGLIVAESVLLTVIGGGLAFLIAFPLIKGIAKQISGVMPAFFINREYVLLGFGLMVLLGIVSGAFPAIRALTMKNVDALRRVV